VLRLGVSFFATLLVVGSSTATFRQGSVRRMNTPPRFTRYGRAGPLASRRMQPRNINICELNGGIVMSPYETEVQWDYPYKWAPLQLIAVEGLRNYKLDADEDRISVKFLSTVMGEFSA